ncbi:MAG: CPBP family intramembrane metalloprotease [Anaerolineae bacterium]|nr:CPBP family intramembrane metalloprotease [Anaerolineae bacterium]
MTCLTLNIEIGSAILKANAPVVFFEEFIFRGILWMALRKIKLSERWILLIQAALFGLAHYYFYFHYPVFLFVVIPISGILFGAMVYRTKSIFLSLIFHFLFNIISNLLL